MRLLTSVLGDRVRTPTDTPTTAGATWSGEGTGSGGHGQGRRPTRDGRVGREEGLGTETGGPGPRQRTGTGLFGVGT